MAPERTDRYWIGIKLLVGLFVGSFAAFTVVAAISGVPEGAEVTLSTYPLAAFLLYVISVTLVLGALPLCYLVSRDKRELAKDHSEVNERHWITVGVLSYFTAGVYPLWYLLARHLTAETDASRGVLGRALNVSRAASRTVGSLAAAWIGRLGRRRNDG